jgi:hypothetical protein
VTTCPCPPVPVGQRAFWCDVHQCAKTEHRRRLCIGNPSYRAAWDEGRGPGQLHGDTGQPRELPAWLQCGHRGEVAKTLFARDYGCGCGEITLHRCDRFDELVVLKLPKTQKPIVVTGYTGRACKTCPIPADSPVQRLSASLRQPGAEPAHTAPGSVAAAFRQTR